MQQIIPPSGNDKLAKILGPDHPLCKEDVIWVLEFVKKKVADEDPCLLDLSQPRLLKNFQHFAEAALLMLHPRPFGGHEADRLRICLQEAAFGLYPAKN